MNAILATPLLFAIVLPAFAAGGPLNSVPEIDGSLAVQFLALAGGWAAFLKKTKR